jgi:hypothetical protein
MLRPFAPAAAGIAAALVTTAAGERTARAVDPFEIQVYDGTANPAGAAGVELHLNDWATGHRDATSPELPLHGQFHATLEPSFGVLPFWELGGYLQTAVRDDGTFDYAGVKLRSKFVTPPGWDPHWRLGVNLELSLLPERYDRDRWGTEVRPIAAWETERFLFAFNPILDQPLAGGDASLGPSFEPAAKAAVKVGPAAAGPPVALGIEYFASFGPLGGPLAWRDQEHYLYEVVDLLAIEHFELNAGLGEGLTPASAGIVAKVILGYTFELAEPAKHDVAAATRQPLAASNRRSRTP